MIHRGLYENIVINDFDFSYEVRGKYKNIEENFEKLIDISVSTHRDFEIIKVLEKIAIDSLYILEGKKEGIKSKHELEAFYKLSEKIDYPLLSARFEKNDQNKITEFEDFIACEISNFKKKLWEKFLENKENIIKVHFKKKVTNSFFYFKLIFAIGLFGFLLIGIGGLVGFKFVAPLAYFLKLGIAFAIAQTILELLVEATISIKLFLEKENRFKFSLFYSILLPIGFWGLLGILNNGANLELFLNNMKEIIERIDGFRLITSLVVGFIGVHYVLFEGKQPESYHLIRNSTSLSVGFFIFAFLIESMGSRKFIAQKDLAKIYFNIGYLFLNFVFGAYVSYSALIAKKILKEKA